jgi:hypothetical protein
MNSFIRPPGPSSTNFSPKKMLTHGFTAVHSRASLRQPDHGLELADGDPPAGLDAAAGVVLPQVLVLLHQELGRLFRQLGLEQARKVDVPICKNLTN